MPRGGTGTCRASRRASRGGSSPPRTAHTDTDTDTNTDTDTVILFDVMDTIVHDPFYTAMPAYFDLTFEQLLEQKHPTAWIDFESNRLTEDEFFAIFFKDGRRIDRHDFVQRVLMDNYEVLPGMDGLLRSLRGHGFDLRAFSNYPVWYEYVEEACGLSKYLSWEFVSCLPPLSTQGLRKPSEGCFQVVMDSLRDGVAGSVPRVLFVDDRAANVDAAERAGMEGILFEGAEALASTLGEKLGVTINE
jgi:FMN phosphatase YigB (HAD superfamily)